MRRAARVDAKAIGLTENHVQQAAVLFLQFDGWRAIRTDPVSDRSKGKGFGEIGMPDYLFIRYGLQVQVEDETEGFRVRNMLPPAAEVLWLEFKRPGGKLTASQKAWHDVERSRGALVYVCGETVDWFPRLKEWYESSGLQRRTPAQFARAMNEG